MIPILYDKHETTFLTYGLGTIDDLILCEVESKANDGYYLYMEYPDTGRYADVFEHGLKIKADVDRRHKNQTFIINRVHKNSKDQVIKVYAINDALWSMYDKLKPQINGQGDATQALQTWNDNLLSGQKFDVWSDITTSNNFKWTIDRTENALMALRGSAGSIIDIFGGELVFDNRRINLHKEAGRKAPIMLEYGRNILEVDQDDNGEAVYTSLYPYASKMGDETQESTIITLPELFIDGKYLKHEDDRRIQLVDFSQKFGLNEEITVDKLRKLAISYLENNNVGAPKIKTSIKFVDLSTTLDYEDIRTLEEVVLYDRIPVFYPKYGIIDDNVKVTRLVYDPINEENKVVDVGFVGRSARTSITGSVQNQLDNIQNQTNELAKQVPYLMNAKGNRIWYTTPDENMEHKIGDVWFEKNGEYERMRIWNGTIWEIILDTEDLASIDRKVDEAHAKANQLTEEIASARDKADKAILDSGNALDISEGAKQLIDSTVKSTEDLKVQINEEVSNLNQLIADLDTAGGNLFSIEQAKQTKNDDGTYTLVIPVEADSNYAVASTNSDVTVNGLKVPQVINTDDNTTITVVVPQSVIDGTDKVMVNKGTDYQDWRPNIYDNQMRINELYNRLMLNDSKLEDALREIKESANKIDNLESQSNVTMDVIGNDGMVSYSKNRLSVPDKGDKTTFVLPKYESVSIGHNGEGFILGKTYTLSWAQLEENCVGLNTVNITLKE